MKTVHIDFSNNNLKAPPPVDIVHWPVLNAIDFRQNEHLPCFRIRKFMTNHPSITVYHDCDQQEFIASYMTESYLPSNYATSQETTPDKQDDGSGGKHNWRVEWIIILTDCLVMLTVLIMYGFHKGLLFLRKRLISKQSNLTQSEGEEQELQSLHRRHTVHNLPDVVQESIV
jgi:hypothetical protein